MVGIGRHGEASIYTSVNLYIISLANMALPIESGQNLEFREDLMTSIKNVAIIAYTSGAKEVREYYNNQSIK